MYKDSVGKPETDQPDGRVPTIKKVYISTTGCVEAQLSCEVLSRILPQNNYKLVDEVNEADYVVFYACGLTKNSEQTSLSAISNLRKEMKKDGKFITWGCLTNQNPEIIKNMGLDECGLHSGIILKQSLEASRLPLTEVPVAASTEELFGVREKSTEENEKPLDIITRAILLAKEANDKLRDKSKGKHRAYYIRISAGCNGHCTYCSEKPVFGEINSRRIEEIVRDFEKGLSQGYNRFSLLATDPGAYGEDINSNIGELLDTMLETKTDIDYSIVLNQFEPHNLIAKYPILKNAFSSGRIEEIMSPVQSGSNKILKMMGRMYLVEDWKEIMMKIDTSYPNIRLNTHLMVGFPTESEEDFLKTSDLLDPPPYFDDITVFKYSSRPTVASRLIPGQIPEDIKEARKKILMKKFARIYANHIVK